MKKEHSKIAHTSESILKKERQNSLYGLWALVAKVQDTETQEQLCCTRSTWSNKRQGSDIDQIPQQRSAEEKDRQSGQRIVQEKLLNNSLEDFIPGCNAGLPVTQLIIN